jgi:hypothetical protein
MECKLKQTMVRLMDGEEYSFRMLPLTLETVGVLRGVLGTEKGGKAVVDQVEVLARAIIKSLSYDHPDVVEEIMDMGLVPSVGDDREEAVAVLNSVMDALGVR